MGLRGIVLAVLFAAFVFSGCTSTELGAGGGAAVGGAAGAIIDKDNPWRGAVIGAAAGALIGAGIAELSKKAAREAALEGEKVTYTKGDTVISAEPVSQPYYKGRTTCRKVRERIWKEGKLVSDQIKEICELEKGEGGYR